MAALALDQQALESPRDVTVDLPELVGGVPGTEVVSPAAQHRVQIRDHLADVLDPGATTTVSQLSDSCSDAFHRPL
jgi:hypothetical protein